MLTVEMTSTTANPSITLPRNRSVGSFIDANFKPTPDLPATLPTKDGSGSAKLLSPMPRINAELIKGRKFEHIGDPATGRRGIGIGHDLKSGYRGSGKKLRVSLCQEGSPG